MDRNRAVVYVVDDEQAIAETLTTILNHSGFVARGFCDPLQALSAADLGPPPGLLISDVVMPRMSGVDLAVRLCRSFPCKVLLFSGQALTANLLAPARALGFEFELLLKPVHPDDLLARLHHMLGDRFAPPAA